MLPMRSDLHTAGLIQKVNEKMVTLVNPVIFLLIFRQEKHLKDTSLAYK